MTKYTAVLLMVLATLVAGCGGDDAKTSGPASPETSATAPSATPNPADEALAESAVLRLTDFPTGWAAKAADKDDDEDEESQRQVAACIGVPYDDLYESGKSADSKDFTNEDGNSVSNKVTVTHDETSARNTFAIAASSKYRDCTLRQLKKVMEEIAEENDFEIGDASLDEIAFASFGDESTAFRATIPFEVQGTSAETVLELVFVRVGRVITTVTSQSTVTTIDTAELAEYVKISADRVASTLS